MENKSFWLCNESTAIDYITKLKNLNEINPQARRLEEEEHSNGDDDDDSVDNFDIDYKIEEGRVARIFIQGGMHAKKTYMTSIFDLPVYSEIKRLLIAMEESDLINEVILDIDSAGGDVHGCFELADYIHSYKKPIRTESRGALASAAYLLASATNSIAVSESAEVGCMGGMYKFVDTDSLETKYIYFRSKGSKNKNKLKEEGAKQYQDYIDDVGQMFSDRLKTFRKNGDLFDGEIFSGLRALDKSIVDSIIHSIRSNITMNEKNQDSLTSLEKTKTDASMQALATENAVKLELVKKELEAKAVEAATLEKERVLTILKAGDVGERIIKAVSETTDAKDFAVQELDAIRKMKTEAPTVPTNPRPQPDTEESAGTFNYQTERGRVEFDAEHVNQVASGADDAVKSMGKSYSHDDYMRGGI